MEVSARMLPRSSLYVKHPHSGGQEAAPNKPSEICVSAIKEEQLDNWNTNAMKSTESNSQLEQSVGSHKTGIIVSPEETMGVL